LQQLKSIERSEGTQNAVYLMTWATETHTQTDENLTSSLY